MKKWGSCKIGKNSSPQALNYEIYHLRVKEYLRLFGIALVFDVAFSYVFYRSTLFFLLFSPLAILFPFYRKKELISKRKRKLLLQFREALSILSGALRAGYSLENAIFESAQELAVLYGKKELIVREFDHLSHLISMNVPVERGIEDFAKRSALDDIKNFSRILKIAKRSGGALVSIINHTAETIGDRIQIREELLTMTAARRFEQNIMNVVPLGIVLYIDLTSPGFFHVMYETSIGRIVMTICLVSYLFSVRLAWKILNITL